jgi:hypothetical protein
VAQLPGFSAGARVRRARMPIQRLWHIVGNGLQSNSLALPQRLLSLCGSGSP